MLGFEGVCELVAHRLETAVPAKISEMLGRYNLATPDLPAPQLYARQQRARIELHEYPSVEVIARDAGFPVLLDRGDDILVWQFPYVVRVYLDVRGNTFDETDLRRKRLVLGVVELLFASPVLQAGPSAWVDLKRLRQSLSDIGGSIGENRSMAAAFIEFTVMVEEPTEAGPALGVANTLAVHPALLAR
jgi:hypothetical protein